MINIYTVHLEKSAYELPFFHYMQPNYLLLVVLVTMKLEHYAREICRMMPVCNDTAPTVIFRLLFFLTDHID